MGKQSQPTAPDPYKTAAAQYQYGTEAADYNAALNNVNSVTPTGSTSWNVTGTSPTGAPEYTETTQLSPAEESLFTGGQQLAGGALNEASQAQAQGLPDLSQLTQYGNEAQQADFNVAADTLNPEFSTEYEQLDASLRNSGATPGTPAYDNAMKSFNSQMGTTYNQAENQAFSQGLSSEGQLLSDASTEQTLPINEYESLQGGSQVTNPSGASGTGASVQAPDLMGAVQQQYQDQLNSYNASVNSSNSLLGDISGLGAAYMLYSSDERLKKHIEDLGIRTPAGIPIKSFRYKGEPKSAPRRLGVVAQDVEKVAPQSVGRDHDGMKFVDYARIP